MCGFLPVPALAPPHHPTSPGSWVTYCCSHPREGGHWGSRSGGRVSESCIYFWEPKASAQLPRANIFSHSVTQQATLSSCEMIPVMTRSLPIPSLCTFKAQYYYE